MNYRLTRQQLLIDLYAAFYDARRHKADKPYVKCFEENLKEELERLCDDLWTRKYEAEPSRCFIVEYPKKREVFAAQFRDRIVHHLYFNYTHTLFERTFIQDTYSCIKRRGTLYGIERLYGHIRQESLNYTIPCWVLSLDIRGYFMHIDRKRLLEIATDSFLRMSGHRVAKGRAERWKDVIDTDFILWLTGKVVMLDPTQDCIILGSRDDWSGLDRDKSLFSTDSGIGLPIGNLTSQLFSNVYLNVLDQFMKRELKCRHYCRYVDDARIVSCDRKWLLGIVPVIERFLEERLHLQLHKGKMRISCIYHGVEFLGGYLRPYRKYVSNKALRRMRTKMSETNGSDVAFLWRSVCSYLGLMAHYSSYNIRRDMFVRPRYIRVSCMDRRLSKMYKPYCITK